MFTRNDKVSVLARKAVEVDQQSIALGRHNPWLHKMNDEVIRFAANECVFLLQASPVVIKTLSAPKICDEAAVAFGNELMRVPNGNILAPFVLAFGYFRKSGADEG